MTRFKVYVTPTVKEDLRRYLGYVRKKLKNPLAAKSIAEDFRETKKDLSKVKRTLSFTIIFLPCLLSCSRPYCLPLHIFP